MLSQITDKYDTAQRIAWWRVEFVAAGDGLYRAIFHTGPFSRSVDAYRAAGWRGTLPLPAGKKSPPPTGYTGHQASHPTHKQIAVWLGDETRHGANICQRLAEIDCQLENGIEAFELVGIDVDHYTKGGKHKRGGDQLAALTETLGPLPASWTSSARIDGHSGIRYFRVPAGLAYRGQVDKDIECISRGYRFALVWPSTNPDADGQTYWWFPPGAPLTADGRNAWNPDTDALPAAANLPILPDAWIDHLTQGRMAATDQPIDMDSSVDDLNRWAEATFNDGDGDAICARMAKSVAQQSEQIHNEATSHDKITKSHWEFHNLAAEGHTGWKAAIDQIEVTYRDEVTARDKRGRGELRGEIFRSRIEALRKVKGIVDLAAEIGARYTPPNCTCVCSADLTRPKAIVLRDTSGNPLQIIDFGGSSGLTSAGSSILTVAGKTENRRNARIDLRRLRTEPAQPVQWLLPDVLARDSYISLSAAPGTGKSVLARGVAVDSALGRNHTDHAETFDPARVIYLDAENGEDWWRDGLDAMVAPLDLPNLSVVCYPDLGGLDTAKGSREFLELISTLSGQLDGCDLIVFDTVSRFIAGGENDADTWSQFYRNAIQPLRDQKIAVLRLDHLGKNADLGPRGSSHKLSDVDADFRLTVPTPGSNDLVLTLGKRRRPHFAQTVRLRRKDNPLRHERRNTVANMTARTPNGAVIPLDPNVATLVADMDRCGVDATLGRDFARKAYGDAGGLVQAKNEVWSAAVKFRKTRSAQGGQTP